MGDFTLEICAYSLASGFAAQQGGAKRIELCTNMAEGGTTPPYSQIKSCVAQLDLEVWPIIRPRGGDFFYTQQEFDLMLLDIQLCKELGCKGVVSGILNTDGTLDRERNQAIIQAAAPLPVALHRAFDMTRDLEETLETAIDLGFVRILTSGGQQNAWDGSSTIARLVELADGRIQIMPGAGINPQNIKQIADVTGARQFHSSAKAKIWSKMSFRNTASHMGTETDDFLHYETDTEIVRDLIHALR